MVRRIVSGRRAARAGQTIVQFVRIARRSGGREIATAIVGEVGAGDFQRFKKPVYVVLPARVPRTAW